MYAMCTMYAVCSMYSMYTMYALSTMYTLVPCIHCTMYIAYCSYCLSILALGRGPRWCGGLSGCVGLPWGAGGVSSGFHGRIYDKELALRVTQIISEEEQSAAFTAPKFDFVSKDSWDAKKDGEYDETKLVTEKIFGQLKQGIWVLRGRSGVFEWTANEKKSFKRVTMEDDGAGPFSEQRHEKIMNELHSGLEQADKKRKENCVVAPANPTSSEMLDILKAFGLDKSATPGLKPGEQDAPAGPASGLATSHEDQDDDEEEDDEPTPGARRLSSFLNSAAPKAKPKAKSGANPANPANRVGTKANLVVNRP